eukprot:2365097-Prymnesium_polylepis.1
MRTVSEHTSRTASRLGFPILDAYATTDSRWFASWDGLHYSFTARAGSARRAPPAQQRYRWQWQGGVSYTNTLVLLNMLCNSCQKPRSEKLPLRRSGGAISLIHIPGLSLPRVRARPVSGGGCRV